MSIKEKISSSRKNKKHRIIFLSIIIVILAILAFVFEKVRWLFIGLIILMLSAVGMEVFDYDLDLWKLWETWSLQESRAESVKDKQGNTVRLIWECVKADVNCDGFSIQADAQTMYNKCAESIKANNPNIWDALKLDIYGLDRDKDGIVCEHLPKTAQ